MTPQVDAPHGLSFDKVVYSAAQSQTGVLDAHILNAVGAAAAEDVTVLEMDGRVAELVSAHVLQAVGGNDAVGSLHVKASRGGCDSDSESEAEEGACRGGDGKQSFQHTMVSLGMGVHGFPHKGETLWVVNDTIGAPVGTSCGAKVLERSLLVARGAGKGTMLQGLCDGLIARAERHQANTFRLYQWNVEHGYWRHGGVRTARPIESVVLPEEQRKRTVDDMGEFLSTKTKRFYASHGIPYKRAYLFWGVPGTGKTSLIQALAGSFKRSVCFMQPTDPKFTDDMLRDAVAYAPAKSLIVFEDIDALFSKDRQNRGKSAVTFSGLLNALDGVGMKEGQVFILTTNFREQLDSALIRNGRVDVHVQFEHIAPEEQKEMFRRFFPADADLADAFAERLVQELGKRAGELTPAALQHFFIQNQKARITSGKDVLGKVAEIGAELSRRDDAEDADDKDKKKKKKKKKKAGGEDDSESDSDEDEDGEGSKKKKGTAQPPAQAYQWHLSVSASVALMVVGVACLPVLIRTQSRRS
eukprot:TRINITY_DN593_c0_g1_i1.p1 TRINITY_DN593_c0_g1~~TRINITY_DN593_c0_g1_i1.p1  ORF type:complete len:528 (+),score=264.49 TRINITY_DN593_c0_g1_i1:63-1646(+)